MTSYWIAIFYGHPAVAWVPTHNQIHHKLNNRPGDSSRSPKWFEGNHLAALLVYPTLTNLAQTKDINAFLKDLWKRDRSAFYAAASEYAVFFGTMAVLFVVDWRKTLLFFFVPQQVALFSIQVVNYLQQIGIRAKLIGRERASHWSTYADKKYKNLAYTASGAFGNAATRLESYVVSGGTYVYGGYPDIDSLFKDQAAELDRKRREALLHKIQQLMHERVMFIPIWELAFINGHGPRVQ